MRVVDHLGQQEQPPGRRGVGPFFDGAVRDLDRVLDAEAEPEVPREAHLHRPQIQHGRREVLLARIRCTARRLDAADDGAAVERGDIELAGHRSGAGVGGS